MLRATGRYADAWFPVGIISPEQYAAGLTQVQTAAADANRDPGSIAAANRQFVLTGRSSDEGDEALESVPIRWLALIIPDRVWAKHGARHPLGEGFGGFQDILPQSSMSRPRWITLQRRRYPCSSNTFSAERLMR